MTKDNCDIACSDSMEQDIDPESFIHAMMNWHFTKETGTDFWLSLANELDFDPIREIKIFEDLKKFPDVSSLLRTVPAKALIPNGLKRTLIPTVYESGGTTGTAKFFIAYDEWINKLTDWLVAPYNHHSEALYGNTLAVMPNGPHMVGAITRMKAHKMGGLCFSIDLDPRWIKYLIKENYPLEVKHYITHILNQLEHIISTQNIKFLAITPPLLREIVKRRPIVEKLKQTLTHIILAGTQINLDEIQLIAENTLPGCQIYADYGSTSGLGAGRSRPITSGSTRIEYESFSPFITYDIVNSETFKSVDVGEYGTVVVSHVSRYAFYPRIFERDTGMKLSSKSGMVGARVADISSKATFNGVKIVEGVY